MTSGCSGREPGGREKTYLCVQYTDQGSSHKVQKGGPETFLRFPKHNRREK